MEMSDFTWQHQTYARPEIYVVMYVVLLNNLNEQLPIKNGVTDKW